MAVLNCVQHPVRCPVSGNSSSIGCLEKVGIRKRLGDPFQMDPLLSAHSFSPCASDMNWWGTGEHCQGQGLPLHIHPPAEPPPKLVEVPTCGSDPDREGREAPGSQGGWN